MFLHFPDRQTPFEDTVKAMDAALKQGKFKNYGLSNYSAAEVQKVLEICEQNGYTKPSVYEGHYNAIVRGGEKELFPLLRKHNMAFYAYRYVIEYLMGEPSLTLSQSISPAAGGLFSGHKASSGRWKSDVSSECHCSLTYSNARTELYWQGLHLHVP